MGATPGMRFATLEFGPPEAHFALTVIPLPTPDQSSTSYTLANVNRWRGQLGLAPISFENLASHVEEISLGGTTAMLVDMVGIETADPMSAGQMPEEIQSGLGNRTVLSSPQPTFVKPELVEIDGWRHAESSLHC